MSIVDQKKEVFGQIAATKTLIESLPSLKLSSLFPSINNGGDIVLFLTDLIKSLVGYEALVASLVDTLTYSVDDFETKTRKSLKHELKNIVGSDITKTIDTTATKVNSTTTDLNNTIKINSGIDPKIPDFMKTDAGIVIDIKSIDFFDLFKTNPNSTGGKLLYTDVTNSLTNSSDFNTFLYGVIQDGGGTHKWNDIFYITFNPNGVNGGPNNTLTIQATETYSSGGTKTLTDLTNDFIDTLILFSATDIVNKAVDTIFGSVSISVNKSSKQLETEAKVNNIIDCLVNADSNDIIDDSYFTFTNEEVYIQQEEADFRKKGIIKLECCNKVAASVPVSFLTDFNNDMTGATLNVQKKEIITTHLNLMAEQNTINSNNPSDHITIKLNFVQNMIQNLTKSMVSSILTPKVIMIFLIKFKIILGPSANFTDPTDFIRQNKNFFKVIIKQISAMVVAILLAIALKKIKKMVADSWAERQIEKIKNTQKQLLTLIGVSQDKIKKLKNLA